MTVWISHFLKTENDVKANLWQFELVIFLRGCECLSVTTKINLLVSPSQSLCALAKALFQWALFRRVACILNASKMLAYVKCIRSVYLVIHTYHKTKEKLSPNAVIYYSVAAHTLLARFGFETCFGVHCNGRYCTFYAELDATTQSHKQKKTTGVPICCGVFLSALHLELIIIFLQSWMQSILEKWMHRTCELWYSKL